MSFLFTLEEDKLAEQLPGIFDKVEREIKKAEPLFEIEGQLLEVLARNVPMHQAHYGQLAMEQKALMQWLENYKSKLEAICLKNYSKGQRALSATDQKIFLAGERDIIEVNQLIIEATQFYNKLNEITDAFRQMGWMIGHITKLRVASLEDVVV